MLVLIGVFVCAFFADIADAQEVAGSVQVDSGHLGSADPSHSWSDADRERWASDFQQLIEELSSHYANLEWAVSERRVDLVALKSETEKALHAARDEQDARSVLRKFLRAFGDGHLQITWADRNEGQRSSPDTSKSSLCSRLGYRDQMKEGVNLRLLPGYQDVEGPEAKAFPGGILKLKGGGSVGVLRIALFSERAFPESCQEAVHQLHRDDSAPCNEACENDIQQTTGDIMLVRLERRLAALRRAGAKSLLVDITRNGGGSDWVDPVARALAPKPLQGPRAAFIKHPHWTKELERMLVDVEADENRASGHKDVLRAAEKVLRNAIAESKELCDRSGLWRGEKPRCSLLASRPGVLLYAKPGSLSALRSRETLFHPALYNYRESVNRLPLFVIVDRDTWSAAELFAAMLQDNKAARIVGELTGGAGCGYTDGGIPTILRNSGAVVKMPDCVRLRADGSNEVAGVAPDILVPWAERDSPFQRAYKLAKVLESMK
jgi:hypothetical protein